MVEYAVEFGMLWVESGWNESAVRNAFSQGLTVGYVTRSPQDHDRGDLYEPIDRA